MSINQTIPLTVERIVPHFTRAADIKISYFVSLPNSAAKSCWLTNFGVASQSSCIRPESEQLWELICYTVMLPSETTVPNKTLAHYNLR